MDPYGARLQRLAEVAARHDLAAVALVPGSNLRYFTGLTAHLSERPFIAFATRQAELAMVVPALEHAGLELDASVASFTWRDEEGPERAFDRAAATLALSGRRLGVDGMTMRVSEWLALSRHVRGLEVVPVEGDLIKIRSIKSAVEVDAIRAAVAVSEKALSALIAEATPGQSEAQLAARLDQLAAQEGSEGPAFATTVLSGPNSARPHGRPGTRRVAEGEALLIDFGATVGGYPADITRTFCLGEPQAELAALHELVLAANRAAVAVSGPGVPMQAVDLAARKVIDAAGHKEHFIHRTGHGMGLDVHEPIPQIAADVSDELLEGMVFTIEPGVYLPGVGGVRIEDDVLVTATGVEVLTSYPRELSPHGRTI